MYYSTCCFKSFHNSLLLRSNLCSFGATITRNSKLWRPPYLDLALTKTPEYDAINFQIRGYDFVVLENFQKYISKIANSMNLQEEISWPSTQQDLKVVKFKPSSSITDTQYDLKVFERNIQFVDIKSHIMPLFIEAVITSCPPGVKLSVHEHVPEMETVRYIPDVEIKELKEKLTSLQQSKKKKK